jgi:hypothetical protein
VFADADIFVVEFEPLGTADNHNLLQVGKILKSPGVRETADDIGSGIEGRTTGGSGG